MKEGRKEGRKGKEGRKKKMLIARMKIKV